MYKRQAYDYVLKCSHTFNLLDARGAVSVTERAGYIARIRNSVSYTHLGLRYGHNLRRQIKQHH